MSNNIEGRIIVITGASSGNGAATARFLSRRVERIQSLAKELTGRGGKALAIATDVTQHEQVKRCQDAPSDQRR